MDTTKKGKYLDLALYAFAGLGLEVILMMIEGKLYGTNNFREWGLSKILLHWGLTCMMWGCMSYGLYRQSKKMGFDLLQCSEKPTKYQLSIVFLCLFVCLGISYISWDGQIKVIGEFASKTNLYGSLGWLAYMVQYLYYLFETVLVVLVIAFGQHYGELTFSPKFKWASQIPWGGILCGLSWGMVHMLTKGSLSVGLTAAFCSILYGITYLLVKKNVRYAYILITLMFIL